MEHEIIIRWRIGSNEVDIKFAEGATVLENGGVIEKANKLLLHQLSKKLIKMGISDPELGVQLLNSLTIKELLE